MLGGLLAMIGAIAIAVWGVAHLVPTPAVLRGYGALPIDERRIVAMEWIMEGATLCFIGALVLAVAISSGVRGPTEALVLRASAVMLLVMAGVSLATGARTAILPMRVCPVVKATVAVLFILATIV